MVVLSGVHGVSCQGKGRNAKRGTIARRLLVDQGEGADHTMEQALSGDPGWHMAMLLDEVRVGWFAHAIAATVRPGDVVLDLGTGTGLLAMLAARAQAPAASTPWSKVLSLSWRWRANSSTPTVSPTW